jgi:hypothetical protein
MNFRLWASVREAVPGRFFVTVSAQSESDPDRTGGVETGEAATREEANKIRDKLVEQLGTKLRGRGHEVLGIKLE